uniref:Uncharacterized protein n=1 Tax=viral metagenome TaxID=1070528 RepID=A0A6M3IVB7_9ZZZZ
MRPVKNTKQDGSIFNIGDIGCWWENEIPHGSIFNIGDIGRWWENEIPLYNPSDIVLEVMPHVNSTTYRYYATLTLDSTNTW